MTRYTSMKPKKAKTKRSMVEHWSTWHLDNSNGARGIWVTRMEHVVGVAGGWLESQLFGASSCTVLDTVLFRYAASQSI